MIHLIVNTYNDPDPARDAELREALRRNRSADFGMVHTLGGRPTFAELFSFANEAIEHNDAAIFANADICFHSSIFDQIERLRDGQAWALTRWDEDEAGNSVIFSDEAGQPRCDSQDSWVFRSRIRQNLIDACCFRPGVRGCDNRLAAEISRAGYSVGNPSLDVKAIHLHRTDVRRYGHEQKDMVPKPYLLIDPATLTERPRYRWCL